MQTLLDYINEFHLISENERELISEVFQFAAFPKNTILEKESTIAKKLYFLNRGYARIYEIDNFEELTTNIVGLGSFITAFESFVHGTKSSETVKSVTYIEVFYISKDSYLYLLENCEGWRLFCRKLYEHYITSQKTRTRKFLSLSAEERYLDLLAHQPEMVNNVPVQFISSFLGIKPESLSRIRRKIIS